MSLLECGASVSLFQHAHHPVNWVASTISKMQICKHRAGNVFFSQFIWGESNGPIQEWILWIWLLPKWIHVILQNRTPIPPLFSISPIIVPGPSGSLMGITSLVSNLFLWFWAVLYYFILVDYCQVMIQLPCKSIMPSSNLSSFRVFHHLKSIHESRCLPAAWDSAYLCLTLDPRLTHLPSLYSMLLSPLCLCCAALST